MSDYMCNLDADQDGPFFDADVAFTGAMSSMSHEQAMQFGRPWWQTPDECE